MEESTSFSGKEIESVSLNFTELRKKGLEYIQELSGDVWTDYNSHDPGVTILEQLCYSITDVAYRTSLSVEDLLMEENEDQLDIIKNAFLPPPSSLSSHPVTIDDTRKMIIDRFEDIQNVWITIKENIGYEEALRGINQIEILPKLTFLKSIANKEERTEFLRKVNSFLSENRNIGECYEDAVLLDPQDINIGFKAYVNEDADLEITIARLFLQLLEYVYTPVRFSSFNEMKEADYSVEEIFSGPALKRGFIKDDRLKFRLKSTPSKQQSKDDIHKKRLKSIHVDELQKILSKIDGINRCVVKPFFINGESRMEINVENGKFFHLLQVDQSTNLTDNRFERIYENMTVFVDGKELSVLDKQRINRLFSEAWSKKHRAYPIESSLKELLNNKLKGTYRKPKEYYSLQRHFPLIYGIGEVGLSKNEPKERHAQAHQLKAYLMLFEQHLANHLSQLGNLNEFFNIKFNSGLENTYFTQWMQSVPQIEKLASVDASDFESYPEPKGIFFNRKNRIYNHLLARFGEDFNDIPWRVALRLNMISNEDEFNRTLLQHKSNFLQKLEHLSYFRARGESFLPVDPEAEKLVYTWTPSGLEEIIRAKTGISENGQDRLVPDFIGIKEFMNPGDEPKSAMTTRELGNEYRSLIPQEISNFYPKSNRTNLPGVTFPNLDLKVLYKETLNYKNYKLTENQSSGKAVQVLFQKEEDKWVKLFSCDTEERAIQEIHQIRSFFIGQNNQSEGIYVVDHVLLNDILMGAKEGFKFLDEQGEPLFQTEEEESWYDKKGDARDRIFRKIELSKDNYSFIDGEWTIQDNDYKIYTFKNENQKLHKLNSELGNDSYAYSNGEWTIRRKSMKPPHKITKNEEVILNEVLEEVFENTKKHTSRICIAFDKKSYGFNNNKWFLRHENKILASYQVKGKDLKIMNDILNRQGYLFEDGKWKMKYEVRMPETYKIKEQDLQTIIDILNKHVCSFEDGKWEIRYEDSIPVSAQNKEDRNAIVDSLNKLSCTYEKEVHKLISDYNQNTQTLNDQFNKVFNNTRSIIQLFNNPEDENGRLRFKEMENIRAKGSIDNYGQRRLVFQRKLSNEEVIDEDFFNLNITVILPDWPARFQIERVKDYVTDLIYERLPSHISNEIIWVDALKMKKFETKYLHWRNLRLESKNTGKPSEKIHEAALDVYNTIAKLKQK